MEMTQQEFIQSEPRYNFLVAVIDNETKQEKQIGYTTNNLDEIVYGFGDIIETLGTGDGQKSNTLTDELDYSVPTPEELLVQASKVFGVTTEDDEDDGLIGDGKQ